MRIRIRIRNVFIRSSQKVYRRMLEMDIPGKRRTGRPNLRWKDACKRDMAEAGLKKDNATNRVEWRKKL